MLIEVVGTAVRWDGASTPTTNDSKRSQKTYLPVPLAGDQEIVEPVDATQLFINCPHP